MIRTLWEKHAIVLVTALTAFVLAFSAWLWAYVALRNVAGPLIIRFNNYAGITQIGGLREMGWIAVSGIVFILADSMIALALDERDGLMGKILSLAALFLAVLLFISFAAIISVNS